MSCPLCHGPHELSQCRRWRTNGFASLQLLIAGGVIAITFAAGSRRVAYCSRTKVRALAATAT